MMKDYLAHGPMTATERLVAQNGDTLKPSTGMTRGEELCHKAAYLDQLVKQVQGGGSNRSWTSSS
jgi:hypothetical protein